MAYILARKQYGENRFIEEERDTFIEACYRAIELHSGRTEYGRYVRLVAVGDDEISFSTIEAIRSYIERDGLKERIHLAYASTDLAFKNEVIYDLAKFANLIE